MLGARHDGGWHRRLSRARRARDRAVPEARRTPRRPALPRRDGRRRPLHPGRRAHRAGRRGGAGRRHPGAGDRPATDARSGVAEALEVHDLLGDRRQHPDPRGRRRDRRLGRRTGPPIRELVAAILPSRGAHLVVPRERIPATTGLTIRVPGKVVFLVPWPDHWLIGTTDAPYDGTAEHPVADGWEVDKLLDTVNATMDVGLTRADVVGTYAGLRPLIAPSGGSTVKASREHRVTVERNGIVRIGGGKYTTYRVMARDVIDAALGRTSPAIARARPPTGRSSARPTTELDRIAAELATIPGWPPSTPRRRPVSSPGTARTRSRVVALGAELDLVRPLVPGRPFLEAEVAWAARHELALGLDDVLSRRTRLAVETPDRGASIAPRVAAILGGSWAGMPPDRRREVEAYLTSARREFAVAPPA